MRYKIKKFKDFNNFCGIFYPKVFFNQKLNNNIK